MTTPKKHSIFNTRAAAILLVGVGLSLGACGEESSPAADGGAGKPLQGYAPCSDATKVGGFTVTLAAAFTGVSGQILDGVVPQNVPKTLQTSGTCKLLGAPTLSCTPACTPGQTCGASGACITYPRSHTVGTVTLTGMKDAVSMTPGYGNSYTNPGSLSHPGFTEGADIQLSASGGDYAAFGLSGQGITPMEVADPTKKIAVESGKPVALTWKAGASGLAKIHVELNINNHGVTAAWIECEAEDTGSFSIPEPLVTALAKLGLSGGPTIVLTRRTADSTTLTPGCVQLLVASELAMEVAVPGLITCVDDKDCPTGQTCQANLTCK